MNSEREAIFRGHGLSLRIPIDVHNEWEECRQAELLDPERFGIIIGSRTVGEQEYWVESITTPYSGDQATRYSFKLQDRSHQNSVDVAFELSGGTSIYLGTWHTHPELVPTPSSIDKKDWVACIRRNPGRQLFFVIVGLGEVRVFVQGWWCLGFTQLKKDS
ncbi:MAG: Mov34/MPN/PAD-1 family protein [Candidatus Thiodiazotropha sp.]